MLLPVACHLKGWKDAVIKQVSSTTTTCVLLPWWASFVSVSASTIFNFLSRSLWTNWGFCWILCRIKPKSLFTYTTILQAVVLDFVTLIPEDFNQFWSFLKYIFNERVSVEIIPISEKKTLQNVSPITARYMMDLQVIRPTTGDSLALEPDEMLLNLLTVWLLCKNFTLCWSDLNFWDNL